MLPATQLPRVHIRTPPQRNQLAGVAPRQRFCPSPTRSRVRVHPSANDFCEAYLPCSKECLGANTPFCWFRVFLLIIDFLLDKWRSYSLITSRRLHGKGALFRENDNLGASKKEQKQKLIAKRRDTKKKKKEDEGSKFESCGEIKRWWETQSTALSFHGLTTGSHGAITHANGADFETWVFSVKKLDSEVPWGARGAELWAFWRRNLN